MRYFLLIIFALFITSCASHEKDYLKNSQSVPPLIVPQTAAPIKQEPLYLIPPEPNNLPPQSTSLKPPTLQ